MTKINFDWEEMFGIKKQPSAKKVSDAVSEQVFEKKGSDAYSFIVKEEQTDKDVPPKSKKQIMKERGVFIVNPSHKGGESLIRPDEDCFNNKSWVPKDIERVIAYIGTDRKYYRYLYREIKDHILSEGDKTDKIYQRLLHNIMCWLAKSVEGKISVAQAKECCRTVRTSFFDKTVDYLGVIEGEEIIFKDEKIKVLAENVKKNIQSSQNSKANRGRPKKNKDNNVEPGGLRLQGE